MPGKTRLLIDAGNTRIKWTLVDEQSVVDKVENDAELASVISAWKMLAKPDQVWVASVRDKPFDLELSSEISSLWALPTNEVISVKHALGVTNAYPEPETLGCDRWAAMIAAYAERQSSMLIVSVGTALTIDAIDATGYHLGGLICPGIHLQQKALDSGTNINSFPDIEANEEIKLFSNSTAQGVASGTIHAISALINKAYQELIKLDSNAICYLTGGDAEKIKDTLQCPYVLQKSLVLKGMAVITAE